MEIFLIFIGGCALIALAAQLHRLHVQKRKESYPGYPVIIEITPGYFFMGFGSVDFARPLREDFKSPFPMSTDNPARACLVSDRTSFDRIMELLHDWGNKHARWTATPGRTLTVTE